MKRILLLIILLTLSVAIPGTGHSSIEMPAPNLSVMEQEVNLLRTIIINEYDLDDALVGYCDNKVKIGMASYLRREKGDSVDDVLNTIETSAQKIRDSGREVFKPLYMESLRMTRDIFRHSQLDHTGAFNRFYRECVELGY